MGHIHQAATLMITSLLILCLNTLLACILIQSPIPAYIAVSVLGVFLSCTHGRRIYIFAGLPFFMITLIGFLVRGAHLISIDYTLLTSALLIQASCLGWIAAIPRYSRRDQTILRLSNIIFCAAAFIPPTMGMRHFQEALLPALVVIPASLVMMLIVLQLDYSSSPDKKDTRSKSNDILRVSLLIGTGSLIFLISAPAAVMTVTVTDLAKSWVINKIVKSSGQDSSDPVPVQFGSTHESQTSGGMSPSLELQKQFNINNPHTPFIHARLHPDSIAAAVNTIFYLRTHVYTYYQNDKWTMPDDSRRMILDNEDGVRDDQITLIPARQDALQCTLYTPAMRGGKLPVLSELNSLHLPAAYIYPGGLFSPLLSSDQTQFAYDITFTPKTIKDYNLSQLHFTQSSGRNTQLPDEEVIARIRRDITETISMRTGTSADLMALIRYLHKHCSYSLKNVNPDNFPPLENFLFSEKVGHCELFASAFVLSARTMGISARLCTGYSGGEMNPADGTLVFYRDNAHAWAEVMLANGRWLVIDPTPPSSINSAVPPKQTSHAESFAENNYPPLRELLSDFELENTEQDHTAESQWAALKHISVWLTAAALCIACLTAAAWMTKKQQVLKGSRSNGLAKTSTPPVCFSEFCRHFASMGYRKRSGQTINEYFMELKRRNLIDSEFDDFAEYLNHISYTNHPRSEKLEHNYRARIKQLHKQAA
jgi:hypothetical protein